jgi:TetR/AcrR family transcriptional regulator, repressor of fatR-cypB operon
MNIHSQYMCGGCTTKSSDKHSEIMQAALELIAEHGFHGAPMAMIAEKAGVGAGTIYRYFASKDVLIIKLYEKVEDEIVTNILEGYPTERPLRERFLHLATAFLRYFIAHPLNFRFLEQYHNSPYGVSLRRGRIVGKSGEPEALRDLFEEGIAQQILKDFPLTVLFSLSFGSLFALTRDHILGFTVLDDDLIGQTCIACWDAIKR